MTDERVPVTFWLDNRKVNGVLAAHHGNEKLTLYKNRYYVVTGDTPAKQHFTLSSLPAFWRKVMAGETPPGEPRRRRRDAKSPVEPEQGGSPVKPGSQPPGPPPNPAREPKVPKLQPASPKAKPAPPPAAEQQTVDFTCPYCKAGYSCDLPKKSPFFETCKKCGREFAVRIKTKMTYIAETAGFKE